MKINIEHVCTQLGKFETQNEAETDTPRPILELPPHRAFETNESQEDGVRCYKGTSVG